MNAVEKVLIAITTGESATSLCLRNVTLRTVSLNSTSKSQTSAAPVLFTPSTRIVGFSGCLVQRIASEEKKMSYLMCHYYHRQRRRYSLKNERRLLWKLAKFTRSLQIGENPENGQNPTSDTPVRCIHIHGNDIHDICEFENCLVYWALLNIYWSNCEFLSLIYKKSVR